MAENLRRLNTLKKIFLKMSKIEKLGKNDKVPEKNFFEKNEKFF